MRHLFVPACLCVMTLSNTTGFDPPPETASATARLEKKSVKRAAVDHANGAMERREFADADPGVDAEMQPDAAIVDIPEKAPANDEPAIAAGDVPLPPERKPVVPRSRAEICDTLAQAAQSNDLPIPFFIRLLFQESRFRADVVSSAGAQGIAQFMPETAADEGLVNPFDPVQAIPASARLLRKLFEQFGNLGLAAAAYNAGAKRIQAWLEKKGELPQETQGYVKTITGKPADNWRLADAKGTALSLPHRAPCKDKVIPMPSPSPRPHVQVAASKPKKKTSARGSAAAGTAKENAKPAAAGNRTTQQQAARERGKEHRAARR